MSTPVTPSEGGAHPVTKKAGTSKRPLWLAALVAVIAIIALLVLLSRCGGDDDDNDAVSSGSSGSATSSATASDTSSASTSATVSSTPTLTTPAATATPAPTAPAAGTGTSLTANGAALLPLATAAGAGGDLSKFNGNAVVATNVVVQSAPVDNGFWIGTSTADQVWVQLLLPGLVSPHPVRAGDHVSFPGTMVANAADFVASAGVTDATGAALLTAQKAHIEVAKTDIVFTS